MIKCYNIQIFSLSIILFCLFASSKASINFRKLESTSKIALKVNKIGMQFILNKSFRTLPNKILVNGKEIDKVDSQINLTEANSLIELFWNEPITNCHGMFEEMVNISEINFTDFDTSKVTDMSNMFMSCESLEELDLSSFNTSNVIDMSKMFSKCENLKKLEISNFKTEKVTNMERMFEFCMSLEYLDIHNFNTISVTNMDYMFRSCSNLDNLDLSKFNTSSVKSMMAMFAGCLSLNTLNLTYFNFSNTVNSSYMVFDSGIIILDLSNFKGESIIFNDDILKFNPNLKYIGLKNYNGKDIFNNLDDDSQIIICSDNDRIQYEPNLLSLKEKNATNNCSDYCFSEFRKVKQDKGNCEIDCSKIENEENIYYYLCKNDTESTDSDINTQTIIPETTNIEETIISDTTAIKQTILSDIILDTTNIHKTIPGTTNIKTTILPNATYTEPILLPQTTILSDTNNSIDTTNFVSNKYSILFFGYDNYNFQNNIITFSIYFFENKAVAFPKFIFFTINIIFEYTLRNLDEKLNQNLTCSLEKEGKLVNYNCRSNPQEKMNIMKITANNDFNFNFNIPYDFIISPFAQFNKDKIINQTGNSIASKEIIIFYGNLTQENDYFKIKGKLDEENQIDNHFNLTVYSNISEQINISCETANEKFDNFEIKCEKDESVDFNINNSISFMESKQLLVIVDGEEKVFMKTQNSTNNPKVNRIYQKNNSNSLSSGIIALIAIASVIVCILVGLTIIFTKKMINKGVDLSQTRVVSDTNINLKVSNKT